MADKLVTSCQGHSTNIVLQDAQLHQYGDGLDFSVLSPQLCPHWNPFVFPALLPRSADPQHGSIISFPIGTPQRMSFRIRNVLFPLIPAEMIIPSGFASRNMPDANASAS